MPDDAQNMNETDDLKATRSIQRLSSLQRQILAMSRVNRIKEGRTDHEAHGADLYYSEIMVAVYGFPSSESLREMEAGVLTDKRKAGGKKFDRRAIGLARYNRAQAAISRAMRRLESRGLITLVCGRYARWSGCSLTSEGLSFSEAVKMTGNCGTS